MLNDKLTNNANGKGVAFFSCIVKSKKYYWSIFCNLLLTHYSMVSNEETKDQEEEASLIQSEANLMRLKNISMAADPESKESHGKSHHFFNCSWNKIQILTNIPTANFLPIFFEKWSSRLNFGWVFGNTECIGNLFSWNFVDDTISAWSYNLEKHCNLSHCIAHLLSGKAANSCKGKSKWQKWYCAEGKDGKGVYHGCLKWITGSG